MVLWQKISQHCSTFGEISDYLLMEILSIKQKIVFFVTSKYLKSLTKTLERKERSVSGTIRCEVKRRKQKRPNQYIKFFQNPGNNRSLVKTLLNDWKKKQGDSFQGKEIHATFDNKGFHIFENNGTIQMEELRNISSDQEEDDTTIFLCVKYCALLGATSVCIYTVNTDALVLPFYYSAHVNNHFLTFNIPYM